MKLRLLAVMAVSLIALATADAGFADPAHRRTVAMGQAERSVHRAGSKSHGASCQVVEVA